MAINVNYVRYNDIIESGKLKIEQDVYQVMRPIVEKDGDELKRYIEIAIEDEKLSNTIKRRYSRGEILELIQFYQKLLAQNEKTEEPTDCGC